MKLATSHFAPLIRFGSEPQSLMAGIPRWKRWRNRGSIRHQNTLEHTHSLGVTGLIVLQLLQPYNAVRDPLLVATAIQLHDMPEGPLSRDIPKVFKRAEHYVQEYTTFMAMISDLPLDASDYFERAFLLQYAVLRHEELGTFPVKAQRIIRELRAQHEIEAYLFAALEELDYILYAIEHKEQLPALFVEVITGEVPILDRYAEKIPGFGEKIWPQDVRDELMQAAATIA